MADVSKCSSCGRFVAGGDSCACGGEKKAKTEKKEDKKVEKKADKTEKTEKKPEKKPSRNEVGIGSIADDIEEELAARSKAKKSTSRYTDFTESDQDEE